MWPIREPTGLCPLSLVSGGTTPDAMTAYRRTTILPFAAPTSIRRWASPGSPPKPAWPCRRRLRRARRWSAWEIPRTERAVCISRGYVRAIGRPLLLRFPISSSFRAGLPASRCAPAAKRRASSPEAGIYDAATTSGLFSDNRRSATALIWLSTSGLARMKRSKSALRNTRSRQ